MALVVAMAMGLSGCEHAVWGNGTAVMLTLGLFFGTLQLGRRAPAPSVTAGGAPAVSVSSGASGASGARG
jgi:hypothetical protein